MTCKALFQKICIPNLLSTIFWSVQPLEGDESRLCKFLVSLLKIVQNLIHSCSSISNAYSVIRGLSLDVPDVP